MSPDAASCRDAYSQGSQSDESQGDLTTQIGPISSVNQLKTPSPGSAPALRGLHDPGVAVLCPILDFSSTRAAPVAVPVLQHWLPVAVGGHFPPH